MQCAKFQFRPAFQMHCNWLLPLSAVDWPTFEAALASLLTKLVSPPIINVCTLRMLMPRQTATTQHDERDKKKKKRLKACRPQGLQASRLASSDVTASPFCGGTCLWMVFSHQRSQSCVEETFRLAC
jgi:hypothetical protein